MPDDPSPSRVAFLAAMRPELRPLVKALSLERPSGDGFLHTGRIGNTEVVATVIGIGPVLAREATERVLDATEVDHVVVIGIAGGVGSSIEVGDLLVPEVVVDSATGSEHRQSPIGDAAPWGKMMTTDELLTGDETLAALEKQGVVALDMETAAVAQVCEKRQVPWSVFRGISDKAGDPSIDNSVLGLAKPDGTANFPAVAKYLLRAPWKIATLARLGRGMTTAADASVKAAVEACPRA